MVIQGDKFFCITWNIKKKFLVNNICHDYFDQEIDQTKK